MDKKNVSSDGVATHTRSHGKRLIPGIVIGCLLALAVIIGAYLDHKNSQKIDRSQITALANSNDCSKGLKDLSGKKASPKHPADSIALLSYRASCLISLNRYAEALTTLQELRGYHIREHNTNSVANVDRQIADLKYAIANPVQKKPNPDPLPPELQQTIDGLRNKKPGAQ